MNRSAKDRKIQSLTDQLAALKAGAAPAKKKKRRNRRRNKGGAGTPGTMGAPVTPGPSRGNSTNASTGQIRLKRRELFTQIKTDANGDQAGKLDIVAASLPWLGTLAKSFERIRWHKCVITYVPSVGATKNGVIAIGVDYSFKQDGSDYKKVVALTPSQTMPVWQRSLPIVIPPSMLQSRAWYVLTATDVDTGPGRVVWNVDSDVKASALGDLWVDYDVELVGTVFG